MEIKDFLNYITIMYDNGEISPEELREIDYKALELVNKMKNEKLSYDEENALWYYVDYYDRSKYLNNERTNIILSYYQICEEKNAKKLSNEKDQKVLKYQKINSDGLINAVSIISIVCILGILIAFISILYLKIKI